MEKSMERQYGFYFDSDRCVQCHACEVACKSWNELELGIRWRRVLDFWGGQFPKVTNKTISLSCMHCAKPACVEICPAKAISKRSEDGIVIVDQSKCTGCRSCAAACPFHVPQYGRTGKMQKCNLCVERLEQGKQPSCVATCPGEALKCRPMEVLQKSSTTKPAERLTGHTNPSLFISGRLTGAELLDLFTSKI
jgi:anaerobic dimethyl sulfoxide reductase subunit B